jgi:hypothetical protein
MNLTCQIVPPLPDVEVSDVSDLGTAVSESGIWAVGFIQETSECPTQIGYCRGCYVAISESRSTHAELLIQAEGTKEQWHRGDQERLAYSV